MNLEQREEKRTKSIVGSMVSEAQEIITAKTTVVPKPKPELRSKRIHFTLLPSTYAKALEKCEKLGVSLNECVNQFFDNWVKD